MTEYTDNLMEWANGTTEFHIEPEMLKDLRLRDAKVLLYLGSFCGWHLSRGPSGFVILTSHDGQRIEVPNQDTLSTKAFRQRVRKIMRHRVSNIPVIAVVDRVISEVKMDASHANMLRRLATEVSAVASVPVAEEPVEEPVQSQPESVPPAAEADVEAEPTPVVTGRRRMVRQEPWSAHKGATKEGFSTTYPSNAVLERTWSDGVIDYACRWAGCPFTHESAHSVSSHFASHRRGQGVAPQPPADGVDPDHTPQKRARIRRLRVEIDGALRAALSQQIDWSVVDQAEWLAAWIIEHRVAPTPHVGEDDNPREYTAEEMLDQIAALVDRGRTVVLREQVETLNTQVEDFMQQMEEILAAQVLSEERAAQAEGDLNALRDMLNARVQRAPETEVTE